MEENNMFFKKKNTEEFEATKSFMVDKLQYDETRGLIKIKNGFQINIIPVADIQTYNLTFGSKIYTKTNLGKALVGGAVLGVAGVLLAGTHQEEEISNITVMIKANDKFYYLPLTIGKMKAKTARGILESAESMIAFLDSITKE